MADVARLAGVSHQTVSRVLNDHPSVRPTTRDRVLAAIADLGYRRNIAARALVTRRSGTIGVVTTGSALYGPTSTLIALEEAARDEGYYVSVATIRRTDGATMLRVLEHFMGQAVEGIVVIAPQTDVAAAVDSFRPPVPVVMIAARELADGAGRGTEDPTAPRLVAVDQRAGARLATDHLLGLGHASVRHVAGPLDWFDAIERLAGWREALVAAGAEVPEPILATWSADDGYDVGRRLAGRIFAGDGPSAVFAGNDQLALGLLRAFWEAGLRVPDDVAVVGFDDVAGSAHFIPPLTTVRQPFGELGRACMTLLLEAIEGRPARPVAIAPTLEVRASTAPPQRRTRR